MAYVIAAPEMMTSVASDLATIGSNVNAAHMVAAARTVAVVPAAADEVSASIAQLFSQHAVNYQAMAAQAAGFQEQFVQHLTASAGSFARAEAANTALLQPLTASADSIVRTLESFVYKPIPLLGGLAPLQLFSGVFLFALNLPLVPVEIPVAAVLLVLFLYVASHPGAIIFGSTFS